MRADHFLLACQKNELRRAAGLPLLDIREEMSKEARRQCLLRFRSAFEQYKDQLAAIQADALATFRRDHGTDFDISGGGHTRVSMRALRIYEDFLRTRGFERPLNSTAIRYGEQR